MNNMKWEPLGEDQAMDRAQNESLAHSMVKWAGFNAAQQIKSAKKLVQRLTDVEKMPVIFSTSRMPAKQSVDYVALKKSAAALETELAKHPSFPVTQQLQHLQQFSVALDYRLGAQNGGLDPNPTPSAKVLFDLVTLATRWKKTQDLIESVDLRDQDYRALTEAATYPKFAELLNDNRELRHAFFEWILRDHLAPAIFIEFPAIQQKLVTCNLHGRIARIGPGLLRLQKRTRKHGLEEKIVTLPFEGIPVSLLDESRVFTFRGNYALSIKAVLAIFEAKHTEIGNLEFLAQGITNWNAHLLGWWDAVHHKTQRLNFNRPGWWRDLPIAEVLTLPQAIQRYGVSPDGLDWSIAACATRSRRTLAPIGSHAFFEIAVPTRGGNYHVYSFGKFAYEWSRTAWENLVAFTDNHYATVAYPDENIYFTHRQLARRPIIVTAEVGMRMMDAIKGDMLFARDKNLIYQWEGDNCAKWVNDKLSETLGHQSAIPDLQVPMLYSQPSDSSRHLFAVLRYLPESLHSPILSLLHYPLGAWRGKWINRDGKQVWISLTTSEFWDQKLVYLPAMIHVLNENSSHRPFISPKPAEPAPSDPTEPGQPLPRPARA